LASPERGLARWSKNANCDCASIERIVTYPFGGMRNPVKSHTLT
jgi:hypothetical protein